MTTVKTDGYRAPVIDCPACGAKDIVLSHVGTFAKEGREDVVLWECSACGKVPNIEHDMIIKRWLTTDELEAMGWKPGAEEAG